MAFYSAFQWNAFQNNSFQIKATAAPAVSGFGYKMPYFEYKEAEYQRQKTAKLKKELVSLDREIAEAEKQKLLELQAKNAAEQAALEALLQEQIDRLRIERIWLMRRIDDEECILILMLKRRSLLTNQGYTNGY